MNRRPPDNTHDVTRRELVRMAAALAGASAAASLVGTTAKAATAASLPVPVKVVPEPEQVPAKEGFLDVGGARLWYWDTGGSGEAIVFSHPATGSGAVWSYQQPVFAKAGYRVIGYSRRGHFKSELTNPDPDSFPPASEDLHKLVQHLGLQRFHLVGSAAGTYVAAQYAITFPQHLLSVVLGSNLISIQDREYRDLIARVVPNNFSSLSPEFRELGPSYRTANPKGTERWIELEKAARIVDTRPPRAGAPSSGTAVTFENLGALRTPVLLLTGDCDLYVSPALLIYMAQRMGRSEVVIIQDAGHAAFWEQPEAYNKVVLDFVRRNRAS